MRRYFCWQYVAPRLLAVVVALLAVQYGLSLSTRSRIERSIAATIGAKGELAAARVSYVDGQVVLAGLQIADSRHPMRNLLEAGCCNLVLDRDALVRQRALLGHGEITELQFFGHRTSSGALSSGTVAPPVASTFGEFGEQEMRAVSNSLDRLNARFAHDWTQQFPSIELTNALADQLPPRFATLAQRMSELQRRADDLQSLAAVAENNPLRNQSFFATLPADIGALERQGAELAADLDRLPDAIETGRRAIVAARAQDEQFVRRSLTVEATEAGPLASYLYRQQVNDLLAELVSWLQWTRQAVPVGPRGPHATRGRGEEVVFDGGRRSPDLLLHHLTLAGTAQLGGQPIELQGTLTDFTTEPWLLSGPMRLRLKSTASLDLDVQLTMDRSGPVARDELLVTCRGLLLPPLVLGEADGVQLSVAQSVAELNFSLKLEGDRLTGEGQLVQSDVRIAAVVGEKLDHAPVAGQLQKTLEGVHSMATRLSLDGTISEPRCTVWSNIGPAAAAAMDLAISRAADERARQLMAQAQRQVDERLASLDRQMAEQQAGLIARLTTSAGELETLAVRSAPPQRLEIERLGRLPAQSLFR